MPTSGLNKRLHKVETTDESVVLIPFKFVINGTSTPDGVEGAEVQSVARSEAGEFLVTLRRRPAKCVGGFASVSNTADDVDMYSIVDWSTVESAGTFVVRTMTGSTQTDPTDNLLVGGFLVALKSSRGWDT